MQLPLVIIIDNPDTMRSLRSKVNDKSELIFAPRVNELKITLSTRFILALHLTQYRRPYLMKIILDRLKEPDSLPLDEYDSSTQHIKWVCSHWAQIAALIVVSGADIPENRQKEIRRAMALLPPELIRPLGFAVASDMGYALSIYPPPYQFEYSHPDYLQEIVNEICGQGGLLELSLCIMSSLIPMGPLWASDNPLQQEGLLRAVHKLPEATGPIEQSIVKRLIQHLDNSALDKWELGVLHHRKELTERIAAGRRHWEATHAEVPPTSLDEALEVLSKSASPDQWHACLIALRECLLSDC